MGGRRAGPKLCRGLAGPAAKGALERARLGEAQKIGDLGDPGRELRRLGRFLVPGLVDGEHAFIIEPLADNRVRFVHRETFRGLLVPLVFKSMAPDLEASFQAMNNALKERAEARA